MQVWVVNTIRWSSHTEMVPLKTISFNLRTAQLLQVPLTNIPLCSQRTVRLRDFVLHLGRQVFFQSFLRERISQLKSSSLL